MHAIVGSVSNKKATMNHVPTLAALALMAFGTVTTAEAKHRHHHDDKHHWSDHHRSRTIYVIENNRPVSRVAYVDDRGGYYRYIDGRRVYVRGRYFTSYPSRYYYPNGRPRVGVSIHF
jgi:hypothetical protein